MSAVTPMSMITRPSLAAYGANDSGVGCTAVADRAILGLVAALVVICATADGLPDAVGLKMKLTVQDPAGAIGAEQVLVAANIAAFAPLSDMLPTLSAVVPVFEIAMDCGADTVPTVVLGNTRLEALAEASGSVPLPDSATVVADVALVSSIRVALIAPAVTGANVIATVHDAPTARVSPQPSARLKEVASPDSAKLLIVRAAVPVLETAIVCGAEFVPSACEPKASAVVLTDAMAVTPVPDSATAGFDVAFVAIASVALFAPDVAGENVIATEHAAPAARVAPQPLARLNEAASVPDKATLEIIRAAVPESDIVIVCEGLLVPARSLPNARLAADSCTAETPAVAGGEALEVLVAAESLLPPQPHSRRAVHPTKAIPNSRVMLEPLPTRVPRSPTGTC